MIQYRPRSNSSDAAHLVVITDLDQSLHCQSPDSLITARPAIAQLERAGVPLVLCTGQTRAQVEPLRSLLESNAPFIVENGAAIFVPNGYFPSEGIVHGAKVRDRYLMYQVGASRQDLATALGHASRASGVRVRGFAAMSDDDVALATGLRVGQARYAHQREFDEPFEILDANGADMLLGAIARRGLRWFMSQRFYHITGANVGLAVQILTSLYRRQLPEVTVVGIAGAPNGIELLRAVDIPIVISSPYARMLKRLVPHAHETAAPGLRGWSHSILELLDVVE
jgi:mannosyl-3-phosphoglycerate phosphatase